MRSHNLVLAFATTVLAQETGSFPPTSVSTSAPASSAPEPASSTPAASSGAILTLTYPGESSAASSMAMSSSSMMVSVTGIPAPYPSSSIAVMNGTTTTIPCSAAACTDAPTTPVAPVPATTKSACPPKSNGTDFAPGPAKPTTYPTASPTPEGPIYTGGAMLCGASAVLCVVGGLVMLVF